MNKQLKSVFYSPIFLNEIVEKKYSSIGGQAVIEGVMMRSPNAFVVAVRKPDGRIRLRRDQWFSLNKKIQFLKKPFIRGILILIETMANGIVSLNYSANIAMDEELREKAEKKGISKEDFEKEKQKKQSIGLTTFLTILSSFIFGILLFVLLPHGLTFLLEKTVGAQWGLQSFQFHAVDGIIKALIFISYIYVIGLFPDIRRVFQYHGAEHKSISTFEAKDELTVQNAKKYTTFHPRCGTTFIFFLLFISIVLFSIVFAFINVAPNLNPILRHLVAVFYKILLTFPIAGISYELIKLSGKYSNSWWGKIMSWPGLMLQRLTTREPDDSQLEVALSSIRTVLFLEETYELKKASGKVMTLDEIDIAKVEDIENGNLELKDFLE